MTNDSREFAAVRVSLLRAVFDVAVSSMDFASGFLDDEEVAALRELAAELGVDPAIATPESFICKYRGHHRARVQLVSYMFDGPDGVPRNTYRDAESFPADVQGKLVRAGYQGLLRAWQLQMCCEDCRASWGPLDDAPRLEVPGA